MKKKIIFIIAIIIVVIILLEIGISKNNYNQTTANNTQEETQNAISDNETQNETGTDLNKNEIQENNVDWKIQPIQKNENGRIFIKKEI